MQLVLRCHGLQSICVSIEPAVQMSCVLLALCMTIVPRMMAVVVLNFMVIAVLLSVLKVLLGLEDVGGLVLVVIHVAVQVPG